MTARPDPLPELRPASPAPAPPGDEGGLAPVVHLAPAELSSIGRSVRTAVPRSSHADLPPRPPDRDPIALLEDQAATRVTELVPIRYGRMLASPFAFFRGAAAVMASDLALLPTTGLVAQLAGDAHLLNFGGFASPERDLVFDVNDFDETLPGPFEWDVKRLAASIEVAGRDRGLRDSERRTAVLGAIRSYRTQMRLLAEMGNLDVWYARLDAQSLADELQAEHEPADAKAVERTAARARSNDSHRALSKLTRMVDGQPRIVSEPPVIVPIAELSGGTPDLEPRLLSIYRSYLRSLPADRRKLLEEFSYGDLARKVVGIGSVGTRCWILLLLGRDARDPLFLQLKEAQASVLEPHLSHSPTRNHAQRVVEGQRLSQAASDIFLGWLTADELDGEPRDFYVRQLRDWKVSVDLDRIRPCGLAIYVRWCGSTLARAHARSGDRVAIAAYLGRNDVFDRAVADFAARYADQNEEDHAALARAARNGRIAATGG
jgi:uncharacterized protein (DUF2252 family)